MSSPESGIIAPPPSYVIPLIHPPAIALYDYSAKTPSELSFRVGDVIEVCEKDSTSGWWEGVIGSERGVFPSNFVAESRRVKAMYDYRAQEPGQLSFVQEEIVEVFSEDESGWWEGRILGFPAKRGLFPSNFVKEIPLNQISDLLSARSWVRTVANYSSQDEGYLNFKKDEKILVIFKHDSGWWSGRIDENRVGRFPSNYVSERLTALPTPGYGAAEGPVSNHETLPAVNNQAENTDFSDATVITRGKSKVLYKVIMVGDSGVGKTGLYHRYERQSFVPMIPSTVGADFVSKVYKLSSGELVKVQLWDTAGQERYQTVTKLYYHGSLGAILVYDVTKRSTLEHIPKWLKELKIHGYNDNMLLMLVGNKSDLSSNREVTWEEGNNFAQEHHMTCFFETSALTGHNTSSAFSTFFQEIHRVVSSEKEANQPKSTPTGSVNLDQKFTVSSVSSNTQNDETPAAKKKSCCVIL